MKKYMTEAERQVAMLEAGEKIHEFLTNCISYTELMEKQSKAQSEVFAMLAMADGERTVEVSVNTLHEFFYYSLCTIKLMEPFNDENVYI